VGENCTRLIGNVAVYRVGFTMTAFHVGLMIFMLCVSDGNSCRAGLHNGYDYNVNWKRCKPLFCCIFCTCHYLLLLLCFDAVGWAAGMASSL